VTWPTPESAPPRSIPAYPAPAHERPAADPWSTPVTVVDFGAPTVAGDRPHRRRTPIIISIAAVVALLLGGAAVAGVRIWNGSGPQPEEALPASVAAFARLDLAPGLGQGRKLDHVLGKFPKSEGGEDVGERLKAGLFRAVGVDDADYRAHIEPWFADRFGVAVWLDDKRPYLLAAIASGDDGKATKGLTALRTKRDAGTFGFAVQNRWAVVAVGDRDAQDAAASAAAQANVSALADAPEFRDAVGKLPDRQPLLGWVDFDRLAGLFAGAMPGGSADMAPGGLLGPGLLGLGAPGGEEMTGHLILGAQATDSGVEVRMRASGLGRTGSAASAADALARLGDQPGNSALAAAFTVPELDRATRDRLDQYLGQPGLADLPPEVAAELAKDPEFAQAQAQAQARTRAVSDALDALSGAAVTLAMTNLRAPEVRATAELAGAQLAGPLTEALRQLDGGYAVSRDGTRVELRTRGFAAQGRLADSALYRETLAGMPDDGVAFAAYLDIRRLAEQGGADDRARREMAPWKSLGVVSGHDGGDAVVMLRAVIM
jgi:hypothetical protein